MDVGLQKENRKVIADALNGVLADTFTLYIKTQGFHWNVTGPNFSSFHKLFKELYEDLIEGGDTMAERIRALGYRAPGSFSEFSSFSAIEEDKLHTHNASDMVRQLVLDNEVIAHRLKEAFDIAEKNKDNVTAGIINLRMERHSKAAWMLRSHLE